MQHFTHITDYDLDLYLDNESGNLYSTIKSTANMIRKSPKFVLAWIMQKGFTQTTFRTGEGNYTVDIKLLKDEQIAEILAEFAPRLLPSLMNLVEALTMLKENIREGGLEASSF